MMTRPGHRLSNRSSHALRPGTASRALRRPLSPSLPFSLPPRLPLPRPSRPRLPRTRASGRWSRAKAPMRLRFGLPRDQEPDFAITCQPGAQMLQFMAGSDRAPLRVRRRCRPVPLNGKRRMELSQQLSSADLMATSLWRRPSRWSRGSSISSTPATCSLCAFPPHSQRPHL